VRPIITDLTNLVDFERPEWPAPDCVKAMTTRRQAGVSEGVFASLNLADHVGDDNDRVLANRARLRRSLSLPADPIWLQQVHGTTIVDLDAIKLTSEVDSAGVFEADGLMSSTTKQVCAIMTADCMPVFLCDREGQQVAVLHAGWRGLAAGIVEICIARMYAKPEDVLVWAGPSIGPNNFEIGVEVRRDLGGSENAYRPSKAPNKFYANLYRLLGERLEAIGVGHYSHSNSCTMRDADEYFSYRRDGQCGRMASLIWISS
jgi:YfiH family protein